MRTLFKILRSIITSFLFIILTLSIIIQFIFTAIRLSSNRLTDLIDRQAFLYLITDEKITNEQIENLAIQYIDDYINYTFYKRSYPSIETARYDSLSEEEKIEAKKTLTKLRSKIDLDFEIILIIRDLNNFLSNGSVYLLINIGVFILVLIMSIINFSFKKGLQYAGSSIFLAGLIILIGGSLIKSNLNILLDPIIYNFTINIINDQFMKNLFNQTITYIGIGFLTFSLSYIIGYLFKKRQY